MPIPQVAIVGRPNVGKSSLFNWLAGRRLAIVDPTPGVTRDRLFAPVQAGERWFELVDTGGMGFHDNAKLTDDVERQIARAIDQAAVVIFLVDVRSGPMPLDELVAQRLRGIEKPVAVWRLVGLAPAGEAASRLPFVGRQAELRQIRSTLESCREQGRGGVVYLRGEAGIGKTRLLDETRRAAEALGFACHTGLVLDFGMGKGRDAVRAVVRSLLGAAPEGGEAERREAAAAAARTGLVDEDDLPFLHDLLDLPQPEGLRARFDAMSNDARTRGAAAAVGRLVARAAGRRPLLIAIEDLHWADAQTLAQVAALAATAAECAAVLVMTSRIEGDPVDRAWRAGAREAPILTVDLVPMRRDEAVALARTIAADAGDLVMACVERAEGNPLFLEQLVRDMSERGGAALPPSLQSLVLARMDRLAPADKAALQAASIAGQRFGLDLVRTLVDDPAWRADALVAHVLVKPDGEGFLFAHALIREGVYASLLTATRRALHARAAAWYRGRDPVLTAEHLERAEDPGAAAAYREAALAEAAAYRPEQALALAERGLAVAASGADRFALLSLKGQMQRDLARPAESVATWREAEALAPGDLDRARALIGQAAGHRMRSEHGEARTALDRAMGLLGEDGHALERAQVHYYMGSLAFAQGDVAACRTQHEQGLAWAERAGDPEWQARALSGLGDAHYAAGRMVTASAYFKRCVGMAVERGMGRIELSNRFMVGVTLMNLCAFDEALHEVDLTRAMALAVRDRHAEMIAYETRALLMMMTGEAAACLEDALKGEALARELGAKRYLSILVGLKGRTLGMLGREAEAMAALDEAVALCREIGEGFAGPAVRGYIAIIARDAALRARMLAEGEALLAKGSVSHNYLIFYYDGTTTALAWKEWDRALAYAAALEAYTASEPLPWSDHLIARTRALVAYGRGGRDPALLAEIARLRAYAAEHKLNASRDLIDAMTG